MAETTKRDIKILIMSGGKGTRMWPVSNNKNPKQFEKLVGTESMFRQSVARVLKGFSSEDVYIATSDKYGEFLKQQAPEIPDENFILEPAMRDNLGAIGLATSIINHRHPDSVMIILWGADHVVQDEAAFTSALKEAAILAYENEVIVHVDTPPAYPSVHNGWIQIGEKIKNSNGHDVFEFVRQVEKPDLKTAQEFYKSNNYLIHVGYMATKPSLLLSHYKTYAPQTYEILTKIQQSIDTPNFQSVLNNEYPKFEKLSVDYGLFEKLPPKSQWELPTDMGWIDIGTWELMYHGLPKDLDGNVVMGNPHLIDVKNSLVIGGENTTVGLIGLDGMIVVETNAGILVCPLEQASKVKNLYNELVKEQK